MTTKSTETKASLLQKITELTQRAEAAEQNVLQLQGELNDKEDHIRHLYERMLPSAKLVSAMEEDTMSGPFATADLLFAALESSRIETEAQMEAVEKCIGWP